MYIVIIVYWKNEYWCMLIQFMSWYGVVYMVLYIDLCKNKILQCLQNKLVFFVNFI